MAYAGYTNSGQSEIASVTGNINNINFHRKRYMIIRKKEGELNKKGPP